MKKTAVISIFIIVISALSYIYADRDIAWIFRYSPDELRDIAQIFTTMGDSKYSLIASFLMFLYFRLKHQRVYESRALFVWLSVAVSGILVNIIKTKNHITITNIN
jgi:hypothetical protein